jgi:hypothetical protein
MTGFEPQYRDAKRIAKGVKEGNAPCANCGKAHNRHTTEETKKCKNSVRMQYPYSVEPEKMAKMDLTKKQSS